MRPRDGQPTKQQQRSLAWLAVAVALAIVVIMILVIAQRKTLLGKYAVAIGGNRAAAELSGINVVQIVWLLYMIVGFFAALAGIARAVVDGNFHDAPIAAGSFDDHLGWPAEGHLAHAQLDQQLSTDGPVGTQVGDT